MENKKCADCYYSDICPHDNTCEYYTPVGENAIDTYIDEVIERRRMSFRTEWFEYIGLI